MVVGICFVLVYTENVVQLSSKLFKPIMHIMAWGTVLLLRLCCMWNMQPDGLFVMLIAC